MIHDDGQWRQLPLVLLRLYFKNLPYIPFCHFFFIVVLVTSSVASDDDLHSGLSDSTHNLPLGVRVVVDVEEDDEERELCTYHCDAGAKDEPPGRDERGCPESCCSIGGRTALHCLVGEPATPMPAP